ncbi:MAG: AAA family ATPase [Lentimicrobium sp.]
MKNSSYRGIIQSYRSANLTDNEIIESFIVRKKEFERIIAEIKRDDMSGSIQHFILIGRRGSGKSTLLRRIQAEVNRTPDLSERLIVVNLSEEQAGVYRLHDLWDLIIRTFNTRNIPVKVPEWNDYSNNLSEYPKALYAEIQKTLKSQKKKLLLLLDNIDRIFDNIEDDAHLLRELLTNHKDLRIIGGSVRMSEHYWKYDKPFYGFFRIIRLESLSREEVGELLNYWSSCMNTPEVNNFLKNNPGKIETIRLLTDGMPRTLLNFLEILIDRKDQKGYEYLRLILDRATPVYQERLNYLPPAQRKVVIELANFWDAVKVNQLIGVCKMPGKVISAQLSQLEKNEIVEKIPGLKRELLYRLRERFFNLWLLMTQGGPEEKCKVNYLTIFLENWYGQLEGLPVQHLTDPEKRNLQSDNLAPMTSTEANSHYLTVNQGDLIIEKASLLEEKIKDYRKYIAPIPNKIISEVNQKIYSGDYKGALNQLNTIEQDFIQKDGLIGLIRLAEGDYETAEKHLLISIGKGDTIALNNLANLYSKTRRFNEAEKYYLLAIEKGDVGALNDIANLYIELKRFDDAEKYCLLAMENGAAQSLINLLSVYYLSNTRKEKAVLLIKKYENQTIDQESKSILSIILLWSGLMSKFGNEANESIPELIRNTKTELLIVLMIAFLVHKQYNFAWSLFNHPEYGQKLKEMIKPLYYVTAAFIKGQEEEALKPGPEIEVNISEIRKEILKQQAFYYPDAVRKT